MFLRVDVGRLIIESNRKFRDKLNKTVFCITNLKVELSNQVTLGQSNAQRKKTAIEKYCGLDNYSHSHYLRLEHANVYPKTIDHINLSRREKVQTYKLMWYPLNSIHSRLETN